MYIKVRASSKMNRKFKENFENIEKNKIMQSSGRDSLCENIGNANKNLKIVNYNCNNLYLLYNKKKVNSNLKVIRNNSLSFNDSELNLEKFMAEGGKLSTNLKINLHSKIYMSKSPTKNRKNINSINMTLNKSNSKNEAGFKIIKNIYPTNNINLLTNDYYLTNEDINNYEVNLQSSSHRKLECNSRSQSSNKIEDQKVVKSNNISPKIYVSQNTNLKLNHKLKEKINNLKQDYEQLYKQTILTDNKKKFDKLFYNSLENSFLLDIINTNINSDFISVKFLINNDLFIGLFEPEIKNPKKGLLLSSNGDYYEGEFLNGKKEGKGKKIYANGNEYKNCNIYEGNWKNGKENGEGIFKFNNGNIYEGEFREGGIYGRGILTMKNGEIFRGIFNNGLIYGKGVWSNNKGEKYTGFFMNGKKNGFGKLVNKNGKVMQVGYWKADKFLVNKDCL